MTQELAPSDDHGLSRVRLYSPPVLAAYFILGNIPIGMALYGLNVARRAERWLGYLVLGSSLLALLLMMSSALAGGNLRGWRLLALVLGVGMWQIERAPYRRALANGAVPAPWWLAPARGRGAHSCLHAHRTGRVIVLGQVPTGYPCEPVA